MEIIEQITNVKPIVLLDDVFSELDHDRQKRLLSSNNQTIITCTNLPNAVGIEVRVIGL
jgi:recombinational DNA repair ATPase RecF